MATVYSLVCWGGRTGKTVTLSIASPCVVTSTNHGLRDGTGLVFETTGALPTGLVAGTTYYTKSTAANTFNLYDTAANAIAGGTTGRINTSGTQSGTHTAKSKKMLDYFAQYAGRWGEAGAERCYDGLVNWNSGRAGASGLDVEYCEIGEAFSETSTATLTISVPSGKNTIATKVAGVRSEAFHYGVFDTGYVLRSTLLDGYGIALSRLGDEVDGVDIYFASSGYGSRIAARLSPTTRVTNSILRAIPGTYGIGVSLLGVRAEISNSIVCGFATGINHDDYQVNGVADNNIVVKCGTIGFSFGTGVSSTGRSQYVRNNISLGNAINWKTGATVFASATNNLGLAGEAWTSSGGTRLETSDTAPFSSIFADYNNNDFRPASAVSPQVDAGVEYYGITQTDLAGDERPNYNNGGAEAFDVGCYEFDHGYGNHPATATISLSNIVSGSRVLITRDDTSAVLYNDVPGASLSLSTGYIGNFSIVIRKASDSPYYREFSAGGTTVANQTTSIKALQQLDE